MRLGHQRCFGTLGQHAGGGGEGVGDKGRGGVGAGERGEGGLGVRGV